MYDCFSIERLITNRLTWLIVASGLGNLDLLLHYKFITELEEEILLSIFDYVDCFISFLKNE